MDPGRVISESEYVRVVRFVCGERGFDGVRGQLNAPAASASRGRRYGVQCAALVLLGECGLRVGEIVGLVAADLCQGARILDAVSVRRAISKGGGCRLVPVGERASAALQAYADFAGRVGLFIEAPRFLVHGTPSRGITRRTVQRWTSAWGSRALGRSLHPHAFRHLFCTRVGRVAPIEVVRELMGHSSLKSTQVYLHASGDDLRRAIVDGERER